MRLITFRTANGKTREEIAQKVLEMVKKGRFAEAHELRDIMLGTGNDKDSTYVLFLSISDYAPVTLSVVMMNTEDEKAEVITRIDSDMFPEALLLPNNVQVSIKWEKETVNRYKIVKTNHDKILEMVKQGVNPKEIGSKFAINWSGKDSLNMLEKEK